MYSPTDLHGYVLFKQKYAILDGYKNMATLSQFRGRCATV